MKPYFEQGGEAVGLPPLPDGVQAKAIPAFPGYIVRSDGIVMSCRNTHGVLTNTWRVLSGALDGDGCLRVACTNDERRRDLSVARLVLEAFVGPQPERAVPVRGPDPDPRDNCVANLAWGARRISRQPGVAQACPACGENAMVTRAGWCRACGQRWRRAGQPASGPPARLRSSRDKSMDLMVARFWSQVDKSGGDDSCWLWTGRTDKDGYGKFRYLVDGVEKTARAHRLALALVSGETGPSTLHACDNPPCCNPRHLSWGNQAANVLDMIVKGRARYNSKGGPPKLSAEDVLWIYAARQAGRRAVEVAARFGITEQHVRSIGRGGDARANRLLAASAARAADARTQPAAPVSDTGLFVPPPEPPTPARAATERREPREGNSGGGADVPVTRPRRESAPPKKLQVFGPGGEKVAL